MMQPERAERVWRRVVAAAGEEVRRRGDRRLGTDHLLLGVLQAEGAEAADALGVSLADARAACDDLDAAALAAVGVQARPRGGGLIVAGTHSPPPLTSGARAVLADAARRLRLKRGRADASDFLLALLAVRRPDPAADLLDTLGVDRAAVRDGLARARGDVRA